MGNKLSKGIPSLKGTLKKHTDPSEKPHLLCLHGWRTCGEILSMQMSALRYQTVIDCTYIDAPFASIGEPDAGISFFYNNYPYYEWYLKDFEINDIETNNKVLNESDSLSYKSSKNIMKRLKKNFTEKDCIDVSLDLIVQYIDECMKNNTFFDGILGFSQGAQMVTRLLHTYQNKEIPLPFKFAVLIGGVPPKEINENSVDIDSLHIYGKSDPAYEKSKILEKIYNNQRSLVLEHDEGHNIPSINTNIYSAIKEWLYYKSSK